MKFSMNIVETSDQIISLILDRLKNQINQTIQDSLPKIEIDIKLLVKNALISEPEYGSLKAGTLRAEFGIPDPAAVDSVIDLMVNTLEIKNEPIKIAGNRLSGGFILTMIKSNDINGVINTNEANVIDNNKGYSLPWLEWLLLRGNDTIIQNYSVKYTNSPFSRSGLAIMVESNNNWRVPPNFSGNQENNWTTRAISKINKQIIQIISANINNSI
jgi:hypothetical protein